MIAYQINDWINFMDHYLCDYEGSQCGRDVSEPIPWKRSVGFFIFEPTWAMVAEFITRNTSKAFTEKVMIFDDWEVEFPIITRERVKTPIEATLGFFSLPVERRNIRLNYTD